MKRYETVDAFLDDADAWREELTALREILRATPLAETVKWGAPTYTHQGKNVVGIGGFKSYFGLWFFQGALLEDADGVLVNAQEGRTKAMRQWRMASAEEIDRDRIEAYVAEAMELVDRGVEIKPERGKPVVVPPELEAALAGNPRAAEAFAAMTPGCRREYANHVAEAKRDDTKQRRIAKILPMIEAGGGLNDRYR